MLIRNIFIELHRIHVPEVQNKAVMHTSPYMSSIHFSSVRASNTVRLLDLLLETSAKIRGAMSWIPMPSSHLSFQKSVLDLLPTSVITATEMRPATSLLTWIGRFAQGLLGALRLSNGHLAFKAIPRDFKSAIPRPPSFRERHTFGQAMKQLKASRPLVGFQWLMTIRDYND